MYDNQVKKKKYMIGPKHLITITELKLTEYIIVNRSIQHKCRKESVFWI